MAKPESTHSSKVQAADISSQSASEDANSVEVLGPEMKYGWRFWAIFPGLFIISMLPAIDATILSTVMPTIARDLNSGTSIIWTINAYFVSSTAVQPLYGQTANIFGRRWLTIASVALFALGSGICGGANNTNMLIAGRAIKGLGGGGINVMTEIIVADMVPLRQRQKYMSIIFSAFAIGTYIGPIVGGVIVEQTTWRWVFWLNLPISGVGLVLMFLFLNVKSDKTTTVSAKFKRIDFVGNGLLMASVVSMLIALTWAGTTHPWGSWRVLVPLLLGFAGIGAYILYEGSSWCLEPTTPLRLFANRTSAIGFILTFFHAAVLFWLDYFLPVYFQAVLEASPRLAGVYLLAAAIPMMPSAIASGIVVSTTGRYKPAIIVGFIIFTLGTGLLVMLDETSKTALWVVFQIIIGIGCGTIMAGCLPAVLSPLPESDVATGIATTFFVRNLGSLWGVAIPTVIFNTQATKLASRISVDSVRELMYNGGAYQQASKVFTQSFDSTPELKAQVVSVYVDSLKLVWQVAIAFVAIGIPLSFFLREVKMRDQLETEYGLKDEKPVEKDIEKTKDVEESKDAEKTKGLGEN